MTEELSCDIALVGGGLANGLIAYRLRVLRPDLVVRLFEAGETFGGNHTWSFHDGDLTPEEQAWIEPFVVHRWPSYEVRFPGRRRLIGSGYRSVTSERFHNVLSECLGPAAHTRAPAVELSRQFLRLEDGCEITAGAVIDGRGHAPSPHLRLGHQKFLGRELELAAPHGLAHPIIMDATVPQEDGYRFVYLLPFSETRLLVEDTYYADGEALDASALRERIEAYVERAGWQVRQVVREESGVLPIALSGDIVAFWNDRRDVPASGLAAALFHPTTGYSLPDAVRLADLIARQSDLSPAALFALVRAHSIETWRRRGYFRMLNRMLFLAAEPQERYRILEHFHRLPDPLIGRFYAGRLSLVDKGRILSGRPPVPVGRALRVLAAEG
ncbi:lycopene beta-cyclase CrtY [Consotaella salsifontis]|uniref:Lycopene beta-cyclase n=1 Tax=Consotaella salsifontis TaxID=1365950 RepID=A0A1T4L8Y5_9HYPH|nr:lycopene beta-cyclase CrtY [Consotaella salsifontis]SJZ51011.1 lycopene beta-cyclase [Consotaella salsifontis]